MKRKLQTAGLMLVAAAILALLWQHWFPNEEKRIRRVVAALAEAASVPAESSAAGKLAAGDRLRNLLCSDVELDVEIPGEGRQSIQGRAEIVQAAVAARDHLAGLKVELFDIHVTLEAGHQTATADLTVRATLPREKEFFVQELKLRLRKDPKEWRVSRAETVRTLKL